MEQWKKGEIIASIRNDEEFDRALLSKSTTIFDLGSDILNLEDRAGRAHEKGKSLYIHIDLATGIGKDKSGIQFAKNKGIDGIISTRVNIIKQARELGLKTVQRFFIIDFHSVDTTVDSVKSSRPDTIEVMPGIAKKSIQKIKEMVAVPIIASGLIESSEEIEDALKYGATAISAGKEELWG